MADIYIIYARHDEEIVRKLVDLLSPHWDVWWDEKIVGNFAKVIETEIPKAKCVLPIWSITSRESDMVRDELSLAKRYGIPIVPVRIEECAAPYGFGGYSSVDLKGWRGDADHLKFRQLQNRLSSVVKPKSKPSRLKSIYDTKLRLPALFLSVSSFETQLVPLEAVKVLRVFRAPTMLISAYDFVKDRTPKSIIRELSRFRAEGGVILLDSGNYESTRLGDSRWNPRDLKQVLLNVPHDLALCFDVMHPAKSRSRAVAEIVDAVERDSKYTNSPVIPIVHAPALIKGGHDLTLIPEIMREVSERLMPPMIAIPERELGPGLVARANMVRKIREELDKLSFYQPLHILGTGNPWSIAVLAAAGADSFDGLEWCRMSVDRDSGRLNHFQHFDFFSYQARLAESPITVAALADDKIDFAGKVAFHNLDFYAELTMRLQQASAKGDFEAFVTGLIGQANTTQLGRQVSGLFA